MNDSQRNLSAGILLTDFYQLTMAQLYFRQGLHERPALFEHFFRSYPDYGSHSAGFCITAGLEWLLRWMEDARFGDDEIDVLRAQRTTAGKPMFGEDFLRWIRDHGNFGGVSLWAISEGRVVHPQVPIMMVEGPLAITQLLESALLNQINYQTLIASRAARLREASRGQLVLEFGLRRAQDRAALPGTRAALIGGADFTSNVGVSHVLGFPPKGTHAHSMVQVFMSLGMGELGAFRAYAKVYPDDCLLLVDTIDTLESGVPNAIRVFEELRVKGHEPVGIRLDSGDLAYLSIQAGRMLDDAGFPDTSIVLSNQLDELVIWQIITQIAYEAPRYGLDADRLIGRLVFGVGTRLITSAGDAALDGVYKLVAIENGGNWVPAMKLSESIEKVTNPGRKRVWRVYDQRGKATADLIGLVDEDPRTVDHISLRHPTDTTRFRTLGIDQYTDMEPLHKQFLKNGTIIEDLPPIETLRERRRSDVSRLDTGVRRLINPHIYHVSLTQRLWDLKRSLMASAGQQSQ